MENLTLQVEAFKETISNFGGAEPFRKALTQIYFNYVSSLLLKSDEGTPAEYQDNVLWHLRAIIEVLETKEENGQSNRQS